MLSDSSKPAKTAKTAANGEPAGNAALRAAAESALETGRALEASQQRDRRGRFTKGGKAGPGRPRKERAETSSAAAAEALSARPVLELGAADDLILRAKVLRDVRESWRVLLASSPDWLVEQLVLEDTLAERYVPEFVWDELGAERGFAVRERVAAERRARAARGT